MAHCSVRRRTTYGTGMLEVLLWRCTATPGDRQRGMKCHRAPCGVFLFCGHHQRRFKTHWRCIHATTLLGRALQDQGRRTSQDDDAGAARRCNSWRGVQYVPATVRRRLHRFADRLGYGGNERSPMGRAHARRRSVRRQRQFLSPARHDRGVLLVQVHRADAPGTRRREHPEPVADQ